MKIFVFSLLQLLLEEYANSDPKLALTGIPIVQWPKRDKVNNGSINWLR